MGPQIWEHIYDNIQTRKDARAADMCPVEEKSLEYSIFGNFTSDNVKLSEVKKWAYFREFPRISNHRKSQILSVISLFSFPDNYGSYFFKNQTNCGKILGRYIYP